MTGGEGYYGEAVMDKFDKSFKWDSGSVEMHPQNIDVAVIRLKDRMDLSKGAKRILVAKGGTEPQKEMEVFGWGKTEGNNQEEDPDTLQVKLLVNFKPWDNQGFCKRVLYLPISIMLSVY